MDALSVILGKDPSKTEESVLAAKDDSTTRVSRLTILHSVWPVCAIHFVGRDRSFIGGGGGDGKNMKRVGEGHTSFVLSSATHLGHCALLQKVFCGLVCYYSFILIIFSQEVVLGRRFR